METVALGSWQRKFDWREVPIIAISRQKSWYSTWSFWKRPVEFLTSVSESITLHLQNMIQSQYFGKRFFHPMFSRLKKRVLVLRNFLRVKAFVFQKNGCISFINLSIEIFLLLKKYLTAKECFCLLAADTGWVKLAKGWILVLFVLIIKLGFP